MPWAETKPWSGMKSLPRASSVKEPGSSALFLHHQVRSRPEDLVNLQAEFGQESSDHQNLLHRFFAHQWNRLMPRGAVDLAPPWFVADSAHQGEAFRVREGVQLGDAVLYETLPGSFKAFVGKGHEESEQCGGSPPPSGSRRLSFGFRLAGWQGTVDGCSFQGTVKSAMDASKGELRMKFGGLIMTVMTLASTTAWGTSETVESSKSFESRGVIVDVHTFFTTATVGAGAAVEPEQAEVAGRALVTETGLFAFLETPHNAEQLKRTVPGSVVQVRGKLLERGALLHIDQLDLATTVPLIDFARLRTDPGKAVALKGVNKCQCGLAVGDLPHSCELGHLHHLEADDGKIYHYLQFASGKDTFLGRDSHFKPVEVSARLLPGQFLLVQNVTTTAE